MDCEDMHKRNTRENLEEKRRHEWMHVKMLKYNLKKTQ